MKLCSVTLSDVRRFTSPVTLDGFAPGLNVLAAPNEEGKSTLFDALQALFFTRHRASSKDIKALRPHAGGAPSVSVEIETEEGRFRLSKRWLSRAMAEVTQEGRVIARGDAAEEWISALTEPPEAGGPAGLLWVRQGLTELDQGEKKELDAAQRARRDLLSSVAGEVEALTGGRRMERALAACEAALAEMVTATGKAKAGGPLKEAEDAVEGLSARHAELTRLSAELREAITARRSLRRELGELMDPEEITARRVRVAQARKSAEAARAFNDTLTRARQALRSARFARDTLHERQEALRRARAALLSAREALAEASGESAAAAGATAAAGEAVTAARAALEAAECDRGAAETARQAAEQLLRARAAAARREDLGRRLGTARGYETAARSAAERIAGPDAETLTKLEALAAELRVQEALRARAAPRLRIDYAPGAAALELDGAALADGEEHALTGPATLPLPGIGTLHLTPGGAGEAAEAHDTATRRLADALARAGVADMAEARAAAQARSAAEAARKEALAALAAAAPEGLAALEAALAALPEAPGDSGETVDPEALERVLSEARAAETRTRAAFETAQAQARAAELAEVRAEGRREAAERRLSEAEAGLPDDPDGAEREVSEALEAAETGLREATEQEATLALEAPDLDAAEAALARAEDVAQQAEAQIRALTARAAQLDTQIGMRAGDGVDEELAATAESLEQAEARLGRLRFERDVLEALRSTLEAARAEAREHYFAPVTAELAPLLRLLWPEAELVFDEETVLPVRLCRDGQEEELGALSGGTREQIALLVRLAFARMLARGGQHAPVILDDALVYTDDARIERMFDALHRQAGDLQILVLTCRQRAFRNLGGRMLRFEPGALPESFG